jgi:uncharacterized membrane protein YgcG
MEGVRKDLLSFADKMDEPGKSSILSLANQFVTMQVSIISILVSVGVWMILTVVELLRQKVGITVVLVATFYTMLMMLSHGVGVQLNHKLTTDWVISTFSSKQSCDVENYPKNCAFDKDDVTLIEATYAMSYVGVGLLAMYAGFLIFIRRVQEQEGNDAAYGGGSSGGGERYTFKSGIGQGGATAGEGAGSGSNAY